jgi:hypothetical protein
VNPQYIRRAIRAKFEEHRHVSDPRTVDVLLHKGQQEFQETMNQWKMPDQLLGLLLQPKQRAPRTFMQKFLEGAFPARSPSARVRADPPARAGRGHGAPGGDRDRPASLGMPSSCLRCPAIHDAVAAPQFRVPFAFAVSMQRRTYCFLQVTRWWFVFSSRPIR